MSDDNPDDIALAQLMASRLCHDLVGPLGAVSAGLELMGEAAASEKVDGDALRLAIKSADQVTRRVTFLRQALGAGSGGADPLAEARSLSATFLGGGPVALEWTGGDGVADSGGRVAKLLLNMVLIGAEALQRGGIVRVGITENGAGLELLVEAEGDRVTPREGLAEAILAGSAETPENGGFLPGLSARSVQGFYCGRLARALGAGIRVVSSETRLTLAVAPLSLTS